jgi:hypothetical protein
MADTIRILLQTTTQRRDDDWSTDSLTLLSEELCSLDVNGTRVHLVAHNRETPPGTPDPKLSRLDESDFDELWLFALDTGDGLTREDCAGITRFRQRGGGILATRDHQDMGSSLCTLGGIGRAHFFQTQNPEPDTSRRAPDDRETPTISWPNYHSGRNGDFQRITAVEPLHELLQDPASPSGKIEFFPAHPHEGAVGVPDGAPEARAVAMGTSLSTGRPFHLAIAFDRTTDGHGNELGRGIAESSFHHFADYNWDPSRSAPSFVTEPVGDGVFRAPEKLQGIRRYVRNAAIWLVPERLGLDRR